jgi:hypothetical protein
MPKNGRKKKNIQLNGTFFFFSFPLGTAGTLDSVHTPFDESPSIVILKPIILVLVHTHLPPTHQKSEALEIR